MPYRRPLVTLVSLLVLAGLAAPALACLWDYDTIRDERRGLPGLAEVLNGKFERHSRFFYEQRVVRMNALLAREPNNLAAYDNLAVAHEKLGEQDAAVGVMLRKERVKPGEYTTYANLGTFYLHKGDLDNGIAYIRKALEINPGAHFGREEYQLKIAEFYRDAKADPSLLTRTNFLFYRPGQPPLIETETPGADDEAGGGDASAATRPATGPSRAASRPDRQFFAFGSPRVFAASGIRANAFDGIVGMIRFGTGTSAELYLTLGDLLVLRGDKGLAYRAYQRALDLKHPRDAYLRAAMSQLREQIADKTATDPASIAADRAAAETWVNAYQAYEDDLLRTGKDVDDPANYAAFYKRHGNAITPERFSVMDWLPRDPGVRAALVAVPVGVAGGVILVLLVRRLFRRRRELRPVAP